MSRTKVFAALFCMLFLVQGLDIQAQEARTRWADPRYKALLKKMNLG
jgi:hypothetical protein